MGNPEGYDWLQVLEFSSERKRMSVLVRDQKTGHLCLYTKGADDVMFPRLTDGIISIMPHGANTYLENLDAQKVIEEFAQQGLRTLCIASRHVSDEEYDKWIQDHQAAVTSLDGRAVFYSECFSFLLIFSVAKIGARVRNT